MDSESRQTSRRFSRAGDVASGLELQVLTLSGKTPRAVIAAHRSGGRKDDRLLGYEKRLRERPEGSTGSVAPVGLAALLLQLRLFAKFIRRDSFPSQFPT